MALLLITAAGPLELMRRLQPSTRDALLLAGVLLVFAVTVRVPSALPIAAIPGLLLADARLGGLGGSGLALGDVLLIGAFAVAVPALKGMPRTTARWVMITFGLYLALLLPSLVVHHDRVALTEVVHRVTVVMGGLSVGIYLQRYSKLRVAFAPAVCCGSSRRSCGNNCDFGGWAQTRISARAA